MSIFKHYYLKTHLSHRLGHDTYLAYPIDDPEKSVVLKIFDAQCMLSMGGVEDLRRLERRLQDLRHAHIVAVFELGMEQDRSYLVSEYQPGGSLRQYLEHLPSEHLSLDAAVDVVMQIGQAVAFAHSQGMVHQDIRPENILFKDQTTVLLADFYLGDVICEPGLKNRSDRRAVSYLSPEQTIGVASPTSDQYALGCLLYELVTGKFPNLVPFSSHSPLVSLLPRSLETVILRALALNPEERYPSVTTFLAELRLATQLAYVGSLTAKHQHSLIGEQEDILIPFGSTGPVPYEISPSEDVSRFIESGSVLAIEPALAAHAYITSLDAFSHYDQASNEAEDVLQAYGIVGTQSPETSNETEQITSFGSQGTSTNAPVEVQNPIIARTPPRKLPAVIYGAVATLIVIALLLVYSFNSRILPGAKHVSSLALSTAITRKPSIASTSVPQTTHQVARQNATVFISRNRTSNTRQKSKSPLGVTTPTKSAPSVIPKSIGIGSVQIDSGGSGAGAFVGDEGFSDITPGRPSSASNRESNVIDMSGVSNPAPQSVYQSARIGDCLYTISHLTPGASYSVRLHFAETYWTQPGKRAFNVILNARMVLSNFDIFATARTANKAVVEQFVVPANSTGTITIQFATVKDNAQINAIEVLAV